MIKNYLKIFTAALLVFFILQSSSIFAQSAVWKSEAESGELLGSAFIKEGCINASGGGYFVQVGNENGSGIGFSNVLIDETGDYNLNISYFNAAQLQMGILINGESFGIVDFPAKNWCYQGEPGVVSIPLNLNAGTYSIALMVYNQQTAPLIDKLTLRKDNDEGRNPVTIYVSSSTGNDNWNGLQPESALETLQEVNDLMLVPGDSVLFKAGDTFNGQLNIQYSGSRENPIFFGRYGDGVKPILDGANLTGGAFYSTVLIKNQSNIEIAGLEITNNRLVPRPGHDDKEGFGVHVWNNGTEVMENFHFHHLSIGNVYAVSTEGVEFNQLKVAGIYLRSERNITVGKEKHIRDVQIDSCFITRTGKFGIWAQHAGGDSNVGNDSLNRNMNFVLKDNHFFETGGSGITPGSTYNCLVENNIFEYTGSDADPRMAKRGSGAWFFNCRNVIAQYNKSLHVRGPADSYGMHIDFGNRNVILQYNYSEDSEGGFVEILGKNVNSVYRFNVSVNDGIRDNKGNTLWVSDYAGSNNRVLSDSNFIYNNTIYVDAAITPDIFIKAKNTFVYNNIFYAGGYASIGTNTDVNIETGSELKMSNNLFKGNINSVFANMDKNPVFGDPVFAKGGESIEDSFYLGRESEALGAGISFPEPHFPMAGKGIFKDVDLYPQLDFYGNPVNVSNSIPNIGAYNGEGVGDVGLDEFEIIEATSLWFYPNPAKGEVSLSIKAQKHGTVMVLLTDLQGRELQREPFRVQPGNNTLEIQVSTELQNGIYLISMEENGLFISKRLLLVR